MGSESWTMTRFGDCAQLVRDTVSPLSVGACPYIGLEHIGENTLSLIGQGQSCDVTSAKTRFAKGDILFGKLRPYFRKVVHAPFDGICSTDIWVVRSCGDIDQRFLYYITASQSFVNFSNSGSTGTKMPRANWGHVESFEIFLPSIPEQRAIAHILGTLDDKIELNRRMNETLEAMARALFKSWFVDFEPVRAKMAGRDTGLPPEIVALFPDRLGSSELGEIPEGWEVASISDLCDRIENGGTPKRRSAQYWNGSIDWFKTGELADSPLLSSEEKITHEGLAGSSCKLWPSGTILIALYASPTVGRLGILDTPATANQACSALVANPSVGNMFVYYSLLNSRDRLQRIAVGAAQQNISQKIVKEHQVVRPSLDVLRVFQDHILPVHYRKAAGICESDGLGRIRDALLPKLMSGEVKV